MKKLIITSSAIIALCASGFALADHHMQGESSEKMEMHMMMPAKHDAIQKAVESKDFAAFQIAAKDSPMAVVDTQAEFDQIVAMHAKVQAIQAEKDALHTALGIVKPEMETGTTMEKPKNHEEMKKAVESKDFAAFQIAAKDSPMAVVDTQAEFDQIVAMHAKVQAIQAEKDALHTALGIVKPEMGTGTTMEKPKNHEEMKKGEMGTEMKTPKLNLKKAIQKQLKVVIVSGTYEEFIAILPKGHIFAIKITKENFAQLKALVDAKKAGDTTKVKEILKSLELSNKEKILLKKIIR